MPGLALLPQGGRLAWSCTRDWGSSKAQRTPPDNGRNGCRVTAVNEPSRTALPSGKTTTASFNALPWSLQRIEPFSRSVGSWTPSVVSCILTSNLSAAAFFKRSCSGPVIQEPTPLDPIPSVVYPGWCVTRASSVARQCGYRRRRYFEESRVRNTVRRHLLVSAPQNATS